MGRKRSKGVRLRVRMPVFRRRLGAVVAVLLVAIAGLGFWLIRPFWHLAGQFKAHSTLQPSRLYGRSEILERGDYFPANRLVDRLEEVGYAREEGSGDTAPSSVGRYRRGGGSISVALRRFPSPLGPQGGVLLRVSYRGKRIHQLRLAGKEVETALLEPPVIATYYGSDFKERRPVVLEELPDHFVQVVLAAEDDSFFHHAGVSIKGLARAMWVNLRKGGMRHGGSTLTQQLVKNIFLTHERTVGRKVREGVLALFLEMRYSKEEILQAYLNEIYLGASGGVNLIGVGAASYAIFGKEARDLSLAEAATLAGMIKSPAHYSPLANLDRALEQRNRVLDHLAELERLKPELIAAARAQPLAISPQRPVRRRAPYFADAAAAEARRRYGIDSLAGTGYVLLSTLSWHDQRQAEEAVGWGLKALEKGWQKGSKVKGPLQAALVSIDPRNGDIRSWVGGRDYAASQFDRASAARRQAGSSFKPVVYATAMQQGVAAPSTLIEDAPLTVMLAGQRWSPNNDDDNFRGWVTVRTALERSLNVPTARLALMAGLENIVTVARGLGVRTQLQPYPSLALGAFEVTPVEMATVYATLAAGGQQPPVHALKAVFDREGRPVAGEALPRPKPVIDAETAYLVTSILQGVLDRGTARVVRGWGLSDALAGKTGTSNDRRDSWFVGYSPDRSTAVWVGYDDNSPTHLSGSRAALPIWSRFALKVRPPSGYGTFAQPAGITSALIDPETGELATGRCPQVLTEVFRRDQVPTSVCALHNPWNDPWQRAYRERQGELENEERRRRGWLRRLFNHRERQQRKARRRPPNSGGGRR